MLTGATKTVVVFCALSSLSGCDAVDKYRARKEHAEAKVEQAKAREEAEAEGKEFRKAGPDFSVTIPKGYMDVVNKEVLASTGDSGFALSAEERAGKGWFLASIAFVAVPEGAPAPSDDTACTTEASGLATATGTTVLRSGMVEVAGEKRCQWEVVAKDDPNRLAVGTVMKSPSRLWVVTGNSDKRDESARPTYVAVLESWKNEG